MQYYNILLHIIYNILYIIIYTYDYVMLHYYYVILVLLRSYARKHIQSCGQKSLSRGQDFCPSQPLPHHQSSHSSQHHILHNHRCLIIHIYSKKKRFKEQVIWFVDNLAWGKSGLCLHTKSRQISTIYLAIYKQPILLLYTVWFFLIPTHPLIQSVNTNKNI